MFVTGVSQHIARGAAAGFNTWDVINSPTAGSRSKSGMAAGLLKKNATLVMVPNVLGPVMNVIACQPVG